MAYDVKTGKKRWSKPDVCRVAAQLFCHDGKLFLMDGEYDGILIAYDIKTGQEVWRSRLDKQVDIQRTIGIDDENVYVTLSESGESKSATEYRTAIAAISHTTGKTVWLQKRDWGTDEYEVQGAVYGKRLLYTDSRYNLTVRDTATGRQLWTKKIGDKWSWIPTVADGLVFLPGEQLTAVDVETGDTRWTLSANGRRSFYNPTVIDGVLYVGDFDRGVWAVDLKTRKRLWLCDQPNRGAQTFVKSGTTLYGAGDELAGGVAAIDARTGRIRWTFADTDEATGTWQIALAGDRLMVANGPQIYGMPAV
ncbi:hypothetical protein ADK64_02750 [Streptomyces sp. MMG1121]|nr:hypothetical protein ADK64_02750 [Streptomyces sp. MMG1121]